MNELGAKNISHNLQKKKTHLPFYSVYIYGANIAVDYNIWLLKLLSLFLKKWVILCAVIYVRL